MASYNNIFKNKFYKKYFWYFNDNLERSDSKGGRAKIISCTGIAWKFEIKNKRKEIWKDKWDLIKKSLTLWTSEDIKIDFLGHSEWSKG